MKIRFLLLCVLFSCGGSLTEEQRKKAKADIERNQIKKISDAQITDAAFSYGRSIAKLLADKGEGVNAKFIDSVSRSFHVKIVSLRESDTQLSETEKLILEAYSAVSNRTDFTDNIQKIGQDSILYTQPILKENSDKSFSFDYALGVQIPKKEIVLTIKN